MMAAISTELLLRLMNATEEQYAAIAKILGLEGQGSRVKGSGEEEASEGENAETLKSETLTAVWKQGSRVKGSGEERGMRNAEGEGEKLKAENIFRRAGSHWEVRFVGGPGFHLEDTVGARYLDYLLHHRGEVIAAFDLEVAIAPEKAQARARDSIQVQLDPETVRSYLRELTRLRAEREIAAEAGDVARADQLDADIVAVEEGLQAKGRHTGDAGERARNNVRKAVGAVLRRLRRGGKAERDFAAHLAECVRLGFEVMYQPLDGEVWE